MKLHEEFREYEHLWENAEPDEVDKILFGIEDFEFEYDGWTEEGSVDHFDPRYGHWDTSKTYDYDDFTYTVNAVEIFEVLRDKLLPKIDISKVKDPLVIEYKKLEAILENSNKETEAMNADALDMFLAKNLEEFVDIFYYELQKAYEEKAYGWARDW